MALAALAVQPATAQEPEGLIGQVYVIEAQAGAEQQWEDAYKRHVEWHRAQNDSWGWPVWQIITGERAGRYVIGTFGHEWTDLDRGDFGSRDRADARTNQNRYAAATSVEIWRRRPELSRPPEGEMPAMAIAYYNTLHQGMLGPYSAAVRKINEAITAADWGVGYYRNVIVNSGDDPRVVRWLSRPSWADFESPEPSFPAMLADAYGQEETTAILETLARTVRDSRSEIWAYRADLSYVP
ncbi:MAG TPA: hypothetical protein DCP38_07780 [Acidobacteria bacterium]|nr:hypothetical protein [Acidobacteriota bacterium]